MSEHREPCIGPEVGYYLAGLADGEGHFYTPKNPRGHAWRCAFVIHMRRDDLPLLERLRAETGLGTIHQGRTRRVGNDQPSNRWSISKRDECAKLIEIFVAYPLRSKKRVEFEMWAGAVRAWQQRDTASVRELGTLLRETRVYVDPAERPAA